MCLILGDNAERSKFCNDGFCDWKHAPEKISEHESGAGHRKLMTLWISWRTEQGQVDTVFDVEFKEGKEYCSKVLQFVVLVLI